MTVSVPRGTRLAFPRVTAGQNTLRSVCGRVHAPELLIAQNEKQAGPLCVWILGDERERTQMRMSQGGTPCFLVTDRRPGLGSQKSEFPTPERNTVTHGL